MDHHVLFDGQVDFIEVPLNAKVNDGRVVVCGDVQPMTPEEARRLSWELQNAATEIDGLKVAQVSRECLPPTGLLILPHVQRLDICKKDTEE